MSIVEIAQQANVSVSTVSRYFNKPATVSPKIASKIKTVADKINYQPKVVRPGPKVASRVGIRTGAIAFLSLYDFSNEMLRKPAMPILIGSIQQELLNRQLSLFWGQVDKNGNLPECISSRYCDGVILYGRSENPEVQNRVRRKLADIPAVWCFREHMDDDHCFDHIFYDNTTVGAIAADYLAAKGHKNVAVFNTTPKHTAYKVRVESFTGRAAAVGMKCKSFEVAGKMATLPIDVIFRSLAEEFVRGGKGTSGAFFCVDQDMLGIYVELLTAGYKAKNLDMIGCNADEVALQYISPRPATIDIKINQLGKMAVDQLLRRINGDNYGSTSEIFIKPELVKGER